MKKRNKSSLKSNKNIMPMKNNVFRSSMNNKMY